MGEGRWPEPHTGFRGLAAEVGPNPELGELDANLAGRVQAVLSAVDGDPFEGVVEVMEDAPVALAA